MKNCLSGCLLRLSITQIRDMKELFFRYFTFSEVREENTHRDTAAQKNGV